MTVWETMASVSLPSPAKLCLPSSSSSIKRSPSSSSSAFRRNVNFEDLKVRLINLANDGHIKQAISTLDVMVHRNLAPDLTSYSILLKSCIRTRNFHLGKIIHSKILESGIHLDTIVLNSLISLYSKSGDWETARMIFENMGQERDMVSWSSMISCYARCGMEFEAVSTFFDMIEYGEYPNQFCFSAAIQACSNRGYGWIGLVVLGFLLKTGYFESDVNVGCALIDLFTKGFGDLDSANKVFDKMPEKSSVTWTLLITRLSQLSHQESAVECFSEMIRCGFVPDKFTFSTVLSACAELEWSSFGQQIHSLAVKYGLSLDVCVGCSLVDMYAKCAKDGSMVNARKVFDQMAEHNVMSWTAIITGYAQNGRNALEAVFLYRKMIEEGRVPPNHFTFSSLLKACTSALDLDMGKKIHCHAVKMGLGSVNCVGNALINLYARCDSMEEAHKAFEVLFEKNLISYNTIVDAYAQNIDSDKAFDLLSEADYTGIQVDAFTFASLLSGAANVGAVGKGEQIHARLLKAGYESNQCVSNSLISMYSRCGNIEAALQVFNDMKELSVISWTAIITGYSKHGLAGQALELFNEMIATGCRPNEVTYIAVLSACSHAGMVDQGWKYFHMMSNDHGIMPRTEHYACMVDLLGRYGQLEKALDFINSMPFAADALVWRTLLGACRIYNNFELGKHAAEKILEQEPNDPAAHVLLSNIYASDGNWEEVARIRKGMKDGKVIKEAGASWIENGSRVHKFYVGDTKHPLAKKIYAKLDDLYREIKKMGYVPDTNFVLHDVEEDDKEEFLIQHSEKLALAYGLISTSRHKPVRIFKNLRVCGDCHTAMKYISAATGREIIFRDSNRFHHVKDGSCSCNDYW